MDLQMGFPFWLKGKLMDNLIFQEFFLARQVG